MEIAVGSIIRVKTKTKDDVFGECFYKITDEVVEKNKKDYHKCVMLGGSGDAAQPGIPIYDTLEVIARNIKEGHTSLVDANTAKKISEGYNKGTHKGSRGSGCMETNL